MSTNIYRRAVLQNIKFKTAKGNLTPQSLVSLSKVELNTLEDSIIDELESLGSTSSLKRKRVEGENSSTISTLTLKLDIVHDIMSYLEDKEEAGQKAAERKVAKNKAMAEIARRKDESYENMSDEQLQAIAEGREYVPVEEAK
jgi:hypothetical protein